MSLEPINLTFLTSILPTLVLVIVGAFYGYGQWVKNKNASTEDDSQRWESAIKIRNVEIDDLKLQMLDQQKTHNKQLVDLQEQITLLQAQVLALQQRNDALSSVVTGEKTLTEIVKSQVGITASLAKFDILVGDKGILQKFIENDIKILQDIADIKNILNIGKHSNDLSTDH